jgi:hypothetical protein
LDESNIYLGYRSIPDTSWIYPRCIPDISQIYPTSRIYLEYIPDLSRMTDETGIYLIIPNISGIQRLGGMIGLIWLILDTIFALSGFFSMTKKKQITLVVSKVDNSLRNIFM